MKKFIILILLSCVMLGCLAGCDLSVEDGTKDVYAEGSKPVGSVGNSNDSTENTASGITSKDVVIAETVVYDKNNVKITAVELREGWMGSELKLLIENNTDKNVAFSGNDFVVNGITISGYAYIDVAAGKKTNDVITFYSEELEVAGIECIATIEAMDAHIYDTDSYETICETPFSVVTSVGSDYQQVIHGDGDVVFSKAGVEVVAQKYTHSIFGPAIRLLVKNSSGKDIIVSSENTSVNDFTVSAWMYDTVYKDTVRYCELDVFNSELENNGISKVEYVTFTLNVIEAATLDRIAESGELKVIVAEE